MASAVALSSSVTISPRRPLGNCPVKHARAPRRCRVAAVSGTSPQSHSAEEVGKVKISINGVRKAVEGGGAARQVVGAVAAERGEGLCVLYEDGFGKASVKDYLDWSREMIRPDDGGPRWFCPLECGAPFKGSPLLLFLPGMDGVGLGLILHHKPLGKVFEVRCLHIPVYDRTPFEGLVKLVEDTVMYEHMMCRNRPIYLVGDSFGGCLALAVAARNPNIDLLLVLSNPATSFGKSQLQPLLPIMENLPNEFHIAVPYLLSFIMGDPIKMAMANLVDELSPTEMLDQLSRNLTSLLPRLSDLAEIIPRETLLWKLKLLKSAASYANSRLHAVTAEVLVLCSGKDSMLPSADEGEQLRSSLKHCKVRYFKDNGHTLLLEDGVNLLTVIKATNMYRRSRRHDYVSDFLPPSMTEFKGTFDKDNRWFNVATSPVILSTLKNGNLVRGLSGVPNEGPVLLVGYHMLLGLELGPLYEAFLREKNVMIHGMAHPILFSSKSETSQQEISRNDLMKVFGAVPVSPINLYRLFSKKSFVLLYPGGAREALHRKGEEYMLFWPDQPEFVRMAARFEVTIVPFGVIGEDDIAELVLDYNDLQSIPFVNDWLQQMNKETIRLRADVDGEVSNQDLYLPGLLPKVPGRFYYLFGKPIETGGMKDILEDRANANVLYLQTKSEIERIIAYLKRKREQDPYRSIWQRALYQASWGSTQHVPTFEP
uniref:Acyltransferase-like protein At1g54570, chloroplastic n=1 Tax=Anthurium amnicola TaxID=1678845 RepID=A0A1D1ZH36_9ARAE